MTAQTRIVPTANPLQARKLTPVLGAEVSGVDLHRTPDADTVAAIVAAINEHGVLVFRNDPPLSNEEHIAFGRALGPLQRIKMLTMIGKTETRLPYQELIDVGNLGADGKVLPADDRRRKYHKGNELWHTDVSFDENRAVYSLLQAHIVPPRGGDTEFADMRAAYEALSPAMKEKIEGLEAEHSIWHSRALGGLTDVTDAEKATRPASRHRLVHIHPVSGRKGLYLASHASHIVGWPIEEGRALLEELSAFATRPEFVYRHVWRVGDMVMWDNLATMHRGTEYDDTLHPRDMRRVTVLEREMTV